MKTLRPPLVLIVGTVLLLSGCSTTHLKSGDQRWKQAPSADARGPAAADEPLIEKFVDALAERSALSSPEAVEDAVTRVVNDNASQFSISKVDSLDEIAAMSDADQRRIIGELAQLPELSQRLALDSEAVDVARDEAIAAQDVSGVKTEAVPDLRNEEATVQTQAAGSPEFAKILQTNPELKGDLTLMLKENADIQQKTGTSVLGKGCDSLQSSDAIENLATMIEGVDQDVATGHASNSQSVVKSLENNMEYVLGTDEKEARDRICVLADSDRCAVFSPSMCE